MHGTPRVTDVQGFAAPISTPDLLLPGFWLDCPSTTSPPRVGFISQILQPKFFTPLRSPRP